MKQVQHFDYLTVYKPVDEIWVPKITVVGIFLPHAGIRLQTTDVEKQNACFIIMKNNVLPQLRVKLYKKRRVQWCSVRSSKVMSPFQMRTRGQRVLDGMKQPKGASSHYGMQLPLQRRQDCLPVRADLSPFTPRRTDMDCEWSVPAS